MKNGNTRRSLVPRLHSVVLVGIFIIVAAVVALPIYSVRSSSLPPGSSRWDSAVGSPAKATRFGSTVLGLGASLFQPLLAIPGPLPQSIATYDGTDCSTPKTDFNLGNATTPGDTVCAKATSVPSSLFPWRVTWVDPAGFIRQNDPASTDDQTQYHYTLPSTSTSVVNGQTVDNRGTWRVNLTTPNGAIRQTARFTVHEVANSQADVFVQKFQRDSTVVHTGDNIAFIVVVGNAGPDTSVAVHLVDSVPPGGTPVTFTQNSGPACTPQDTSDCVIASMVNGDRSEFTAIYNLGGTPPGKYQTSATASGTTPDPNTSNNTATAEFTVESGSSNVTCDLTCPSSIITNANTTENYPTANDPPQRGAHVTYPDAVGTGQCGAISSSPASGSFFPVGTTIVTATSETGNGSCTFSVTVDEANGNTTISCPPNKTADADPNNCEVTVALGTPTATGTNVTIHGTRSDGKPMYNCDCFPNSPNQTDDACNINGACTRRADAPFQAGVTTVTWTATSHDIPGPYTTPEDEVAHRTGNASCNQTVTVNDTTPPVITAQDSTVSADSTCHAVVPDYSNSVTDNCSCAASDTSQDCVGHHRITVTQDPAAGTVVGIGPHTIHLTANDGSSNPNPGPDGIFGTSDDGTGNITTKDITFTVKDTTAPTIHCPANMTANTEPGTCAAHVNPGTATATDNCDSNPTITGTRSDGRPLTDTYPKGTTTITWTASDHATPPNQSSCTQTITVEDHENPVIICPAPIVQGNDPGTCSATVNPGQPTVTDNCDSHPTVTSTRSDGQAMNAPYPKGTTTITWTATDSSGNHSSCTQTVTVRDTEAPTFTLTGTQTMWPPNHKYHTFGVTNFVTGVHDNCDGTIPVSSVVIVKVTSDEIENGNGDGNTLNDIVIAPDCKSVQLRSEREGGGDGRVYTIYFAVVDAAGNVGTATAKVVVQHNPGETAVDSGPHYSVCCHGGTCPP